MLLEFVKKNKFYKVEISYLKHRIVIVLMTHFRAKKAYLTGRPSLASWDATLDTLGLEPALSILSDSMFCI